MAAASPTDFIVNAEKQNGIIAPMTKHEISIGSNIFTSDNLVLVMNAPNKARETRHEPSRLFQIPERPMCQGELVNSSCSEEG